MANIGREKELQELLGIAEETRAGHGSVIFLAGSTGSGKSSLVKAFADSVSKAEGEERVDVGRRPATRPASTTHSGPSAKFYVHLRTTDCVGSA